MQIKSFLKRFNADEPDQPVVSEQTIPEPSALGNRQNLIQRSELTTLFQAVLEEKQRDLPVRRRLEEHPAAEGKSPQ